MNDFHRAVLYTMSWFVLFIAGIAFMATPAVPANLKAVALALAAGVAVNYLRKFHGEKDDS